jgi:undecaprenyl diphosphate synthase
MSVPQHVAIILDGNGRWAKSKGMPRTYGHTVGAKNIETICRAADDLGIKYITYYAFSTENWNRPAPEVATLMKLLRTYLRGMPKKCNANNIRARIIGDVSGLDEDMQDAVRSFEEQTKENDGLQMQIAINYGGRDEIIRAFNKILEEKKNGQFPEGPVTEADLQRHLDTAGIPDPDLMIRTSGEMRLSNYLLWQLAYSEFYFTPVPWPAFTPQDLKEAVEAYEKRDRRYGRVKEG